MPQEFIPADGQNVEYKAFKRGFVHVGDDEEKGFVLFVFATLTLPDSGWEFMLVRQEGEPDVWRLLGDAPGFGDGDRTYYVASGSSEHLEAEVPEVITVTDANGSQRVKVEPWADRS